MIAIVPPVVFDYQSHPRKNERLEKWQSHSKTGSTKSFPIRQAMSTAKRITSTTTDGIKMDITLYLVGDDEDDAMSNAPFDSLESAQSNAEDTGGTIYEVLAKIDFDTVRILP